MRGIGLLALLVVVAIIFILFTQDAQHAGKVQKEVRPQVEQLAGVDASGQRVSDTYSLEAVEEHGRFHGERVKSIQPNSMMKSFYGLQEGDVIIEVGAQGGVMMRADQENDA